MTSKSVKEIESIGFVLTQLRDSLRGTEDEIDNMSVIPEEEDYGDDANIIFSNKPAKGLEVKRYGGYLTHPDGTINGDTISTTSGTNLLKYYHLDNDGEVVPGLPDDASGRCAVVLNATDYYDSRENAKYEKLLESDSWLAFLSKDGVLYFKGRKEIEDASICECLMHCWHKGDKKGPMRYERKVLLDIEKGHWIPCKVPRKFFINMFGFKKV